MILGTSRAKPQNPAHSQPRLQPELFTIANDEETCVRFFRLDLTGDQQLHFDEETLRSVNSGQFYVIPVVPKYAAALGAQVMRQPLLTIIASLNHPNGTISLLTAVSPGSL
jgi:hypothetical protein